jgi:hypothetical protein
LQVTVNSTTFTLGTDSQLASNGSGHWTLTTTTAIPDGTYTVAVHTVDAAGNVANDTATNALTIDTVPPVTPTVNASIANTSKPVITGTWDEATAGGAILLQVTVNSTVFTLGTSPQLASNGSGHWTLTTTTAIPDGIYTVAVHTADAAGNVANSTTSNQLQIETVAPVVPTVNSLVTNQSKPVLTGTWDQTSVDKATVFQVTVAGTTYTFGSSSQLTSDGSGHWTLTTTATIPDGTYSVQVHTANTAGFAADVTATNALIVETAAPAAPTANPLIANTGKPVLTGTWDETSADKASLFQVTVAGTTYTFGSSSQLTSDGSGNWTLTTTATIPDGTYSVQVHTANAAGFTADVTVSGALILDTEADSDTQVTEQTTQRG